MSMICTVLGLTSVQVVKLKASPALARGVAIQCGGDQPPASLRPGLAMLGPFERPIDLQQSWHMLHYLFTGHIDASPAPGDSLLTGKELGDDVGYGPARLHDVPETKVFAQFLQSLTLEIVQGRVNSREMQMRGVYAVPMGETNYAEHDEDIRREMSWAFPVLRNYVTKMAGKRDGLLIWLN